MLKVNRRFAMRSAAVLSVLAVAVLLVTSSAPTQASAPTAPADVFTCTPTGVAAFTNRVHVRCNPAAPGGISYFAVCTSPDSASASRFLSIFTTAKVTAKGLDIYYTPSNTSGTACGCASGDCRVISGAEVKP
jgi:hypothetical protein